jgi:hypothetical protein
MIFSRTTRSVLLVALAASLALLGGAAAESKLLVDAEAKLMHDLPPALRDSLKATLEQVRSGRADSAIRGRMLATTNGTDHADCAALFAGTIDTAALDKALGDSVYNIMIKVLLSGLSCPATLGGPKTQAECDAYTPAGQAAYKGLCKWNATASPPGCDVNPDEIKKWEASPGYKKASACAAITKEGDCKLPDCNWKKDITGSSSCSGSPATMTEGVTPVFKIVLKQQLTCQDKAQADCTSKVGCEWASSDGGSCDTKGFPKAEMEAACPSGKYITDGDGYVIGFSPAASKSVFFAVAVAVAIAALMVAM